MDTQVVQVLDKLFTGLSVKVEVARVSDGNDMVVLRMPTVARKFLFDSQTGNYLGNVADAEVPQVRPQENRSVVRGAPGALLPMLLPKPASSAPFDNMTVLVTGDGDALQGPVFLGAGPHTGEEHRSMGAGHPLNLLLSSMLKRFG